jgi:L-asparaginase / beta-aspartyl-peptidase
MRRIALTALAAAALAACATPGAQTPATTHDAFFAALQQHCGNAYEGEVVVRLPDPDTVFTGKRLVMHVRQCAADEIRVPFHVGEDRSRTWIITRTAEGLRLKHDHRHADGSEDEITQYGGDTRDAGTAARQEFPADAFTAVVIHGGAGTMSRSSMTPEAEAGYHAALEQALRAGHEILAAGGTSLDAVEAAVRMLEDSPLFNAGRGAVFTSEGRNELDAAVMDGRTLQAGAVAGVTRVRNPISLARLVMEQSPHVMMIGQGAETFGEQHGVEMVDPSWFFTEARWNSLRRALEAEGRPVPPRPPRRPRRRRADTAAPDTAGDRKFGTVGAVALDRHGNLAAATSTGGMTNKRFGRVGDVPIIGAGTYASPGAPCRPPVTASSSSATSSPTTSAPAWTTSGSPSKRAQPRRRHGPARGAAGRGRHHRHGCTGQLHHALQLDGDVPGRRRDARFHGSVRRWGQTPRRGVSTGGTAWQRRPSITAPAPPPPPRPPLRDRPGPGRPLAATRTSPRRRTSPPPAAPTAR